MRQAVGVVPGHLLGQQPPFARLARDLRETRGVAEGIREPDLGGLDPESLLEPPGALGELAHQGLPAGQVGVGLDPHAADRQPPPVRDGGPDALEQLRVVRAHPLVLLGGGRHEDHLGPLGEQGERVGERPRALAHGLPRGPQPGGVDVSVAHRHHPVRARHGRRGEYPRQFRPPGDGRARHVGRIDGVGTPLQGLTDPGGPGRGRGQHAEQSSQHPQVVREFLDLVVPFGEHHLAEHVQGLLPRGVAVAQRGGREVEAGVRVGVGGGLDVEVDPIAGAHVGGGDVMVERADSLEDPPVRRPRRALALETGRAGAEAEVDEHVHGRQVVRPLAGDVEPPGAPRCAPRCSGRDGVVLGGLGLGERHRLSGCSPRGHPQGDGPPMQCGGDPLVDQAPKPARGVVAIEVHESLRCESGTDVADGHDI